VEFGGVLGVQWGKGLERFLERSAKHLQAYLDEMT
jgi:hypothetical protein